MTKMWAYSNIHMFTGGKFKWFHAHTLHSTCLLVYNFTSGGRHENDIKISFKHLKNLPNAIYGNGLKPYVRGYPFWNAKYSMTIPCHQNYLWKLHKKTLRNDKDKKRFVSKTFKIRNTLWCNLDGACQPTWYINMYTRKFKCVNKASGATNVIRR